MTHASREELTLFSGPIIERNGQERMYVGAFIPEGVDAQDRIKVQQCIGFVAVPNFDPTSFAQPRDGWIVRPARESEETVEDVFTKVCTTAHYISVHDPITMPVLERLVGEDAIVPPRG